MELDPDLIHKLWTHTNTQNPDFINILNPDILKMVLRPHHIFNIFISSLSCTLLGILFSPSLETTTTFSLLHIYWMLP